MTVSYPDLVYYGSTDGSTDSETTTTTCTWPSKQMWVVDSAGHIQVYQDKDYDDLIKSWAISAIRAQPFF